LPDGWRWSTLGDVCERVAQIDPRKAPARQFRYIDISAVDSRANRIAEPKATYGAEAPSRARKPVKDGDVLFSTVRTYLRNVAPVPPELDGHVASTGFCVLRAGSEVDPRFLFRYVLTDEFTARISELQRGISYPAITDRDVFAQPVPLPPLPEQQRLVQKIERLLEQSRTAREALDRIPPLLKRFRQAVLAKAFRGELTERDPNDEPASVLLERIREERRRKWEEDLRARGKDPHRSKYVEPEPPDTRALPGLPEGWAWASMGHVIHLLQYGSSMKADGQEGSGVPIIRMGNIQDGGFILKGMKYVDRSSEDIPRYLLQEDDILVNRTNSPELVGKAARWDKDAEYIFASYLIRLRADTSVISPRYLIFVMNSEIAKGHIARVRHQVAGQSNINSQDIRGIPVPLAPLNEQRLIAAKVEALFEQADAIHREVDKALSHAQRVDQAVLARAFQGEL
jgi:type I restriction enzyme S subunit